MLLYALSLELILKARALYEERQWINSEEKPSFENFLKRWNGNNKGHDFFRIIEHYKIEINDEDRKLLENFKEFTGWAGRYPYPKGDSLTKEMEKNGRPYGVISLKFKEGVHAFINREIIVMAKD
jgi:hypothetical protein